MLWLKYISKNNFTGENDLNLYVTLWDPGNNSRSLGCGNLCRLNLHLACTNLGFFINADISSKFKIPKPHGLFSFFPTAPLCSRDGDGRHFERTAAQ
jgi:hypothetical protein